MNWPTREKIARPMKLIVAIAALTTMLGVVSGVAQSEVAGAATYSRTTAVQHTQYAGPWSVYSVRLTATDSWNGSGASGYVSGVSCNINYPTGAGNFCNGYWYGSYRYSNGVWEDWLTFRVSYISPFALFRVAYSTCVYLRVDTYPSGYTTYQNFANKNLSLGHSC